MYIFIKKHNPDNQFDDTDVIIKNINHDANLTNLFDTFKSFLKACGYEGVDEFFNED